MRRKRRGDFIAERLCGVEKKFLVRTACLFGNCCKFSLPVGKLPRILQQDQRSLSPVGTEVFIDGLGFISYREVEGFVILVQ